MKKSIFALALILTAGINASADEGMWMVNAISKALEANMKAKGLALSAGEIYNEEAGALADAIVSLDFGCTGSVISSEGLVITNHHCAYSDVYDLSTEEHNYLEDGFWAFKSTDEVPIKGKGIQFLKKVLDVTAEVEQMKAEAEAAGQVLGSRKLSYNIEKKYSEQTGLEASLASMWGGSKYYLALYLTYTDIRLVAAPPVSIAAFGGDIDNWEWPQHKCDFALYRIYTAPDGSPAEYDAANVPLKSAHKLTISTDGYGDGDFAMVIGYPGSTDRYASAAKIDYTETLSLPICNDIRGEQMAIEMAWMNADPAVRLKYSDPYFTLSNIQENNAGMVECYGRFGVVAQRREQEKELQAWIEADESRKAQWGDLLERLDRTYQAIRETEKNLIYFRETIIRGTKLGVISTRLNSYRRSLNVPSSVENMKRINAADYDAIDLRVERDLFRYALEVYYTNVDSDWWGDFQKAVYVEHNGDFDSICAALWDNSWMTNERKIVEFMTTDGPELEKYCDDLLFQFFQEVKISVFNEELSRIQGEETVTVLSREYTQALYQMRLDKGIVQYPDANSTMRLTYGTVGGYSPRDGVWGNYYTTPKGILEKYDPTSYDFNLKPEWKAILDDCPVNVNFLTDNDITGGNSGSPVLNAKGELIGLAFDGNKESLASDTSFTEGYNKCVCVDIRFVVWALRNYAHLDRILEEVGL